MSSETGASRTLLEVAVAEYLLPQQLLGGVLLYPVPSCLT